MTIINISYDFTSNNINLNIDGKEDINSVCRVTGLKQRKVISVSAAVVLIQKSVRKLLIAELTATLVKQPM